MSKNLHLNGTKTYIQVIICTNYNWGIWGGAPLDRTVRHHRIICWAALFQLTGLGSLISQQVPTHLALGK